MKFEEEDKDGVTWKGLKPGDAFTFDGEGPYLVVNVDTDVVEDRPDDKLAVLDSYGDVNYWSTDEGDDYNLERVKLVIRSN